MKTRLKTGDILLFAGLLLAAVAGGIWWLANSANEGDFSANGAVVVTQTKDGFYRADPLDADASYTIETPGTGSGDDAQRGSNTVRISGGTVEVERSNCGNQVCVEHDPIERIGEQIVCLPHGLVVEIVERESDATELH